MKTLALCLLALAALAAPSSAQVKLRLDADDYFSSPFWTAANANSLIGGVNTAGTAQFNWARINPPASTAAIGLLTPAADQLPYFTGATTAALTPLTPFARTLLDDPTAAIGRATLAAAASGANTDITSLGGLTTTLSVAQGGTGTTSSTGTGSVVRSTAPTLSGDTAFGTLSAAGVVGGDRTHVLNIGANNTPQLLRLVNGANRKADVRITNIPSSFQIVDTDSGGNVPLSIPLDGSNAVVVAGPLTVGGGSPIARSLTTTTTWDPAVLAAGASEKRTAITLAGVAVGDVVTAALSTIVSADWAVQAAVTAANTIEVKITNNTGVAIDLANGTLRITCLRF